MIGPGTPLNMKISIKAYNNFYPLSKVLTLSVVYQGRKNEHKSICQISNVPLLMYMTPIEVENIKDDAFKITLDIHEKAPKVF